MSQHRPDEITLYDKLVLAAKARAGGEPGWALLGERLQRAVVAEEILTALVEEFDNPAPERVRHLSYVLHDQLDEEFAQAGAR